MLFLDRVKETFTTTGTGTVTVGGAATGWRTHAAALSADYGLSGTVPRVGYFMQTADKLNWEFGYGTFDTVAGTITRTLLASSTGALVNWPAGTKTIFSTPIGFLMSQAPGIFRGTARPAWLRPQALWLDTDASPFPRLYWYDGTDDIPLIDIDEANNRAYPIDASGARIGGAEVDVASAATADIFAAAADNVRITGAVAITALAAAGAAAGPRRFVRFAGAPTLTHNAASLILPGGANITAAAGDRMIAKSLGGGNVEVVAYIKADGTPVVPIAWGRLPESIKTVDYTVVAGDRGNLLIANKATAITFTLLAAAAAGAGFTLIYKNIGAGGLTLDGNLAETIDGAATKTVKQNESGVLECDGTNWRTVLTGGAGGKLVQRTYATFATWTSTTTTIPKDDTIPQNTEGAEIVTQAATMANATNRVRVTCVFNGGLGGTNGAFVAALFKDAIADALAVEQVIHAAATGPMNGVLVFEEVPGDTNSHTYKLRIGPTADIVTLGFNGDATARLYGGKLAITMICEELTP